VKCGELEGIEAVYIDASEGAQGIVRGDDGGSFVIGREYEICG
jgi:hypothetical protein